MRDLDWNLVRSFLAALECGSLAAAAKQTGISQPTLGRHIDELERSLSVILFERGRMGMMPTNAGLKIGEAAKEMQIASAALTMAASGSSQRIGGTVRITASEIVSTYILPGIIADMLVDLPQIEIELAPTNAVENLLQRDADIAVRMVRPTQNDLIARQVNTMSMGIYAHENYLAKSNSVDGFEDLLSHVIIGYDRNDLILKGFEQAGFKVDRNFFRFRCDDQVAAYEALLAGVGIGFAPIVLAAKHPSLHRLLHDFQIEGIPMWLTSHRELRTSAKIRAVNDYLAERLGNMQLDLA